MLGSETVGTSAYRKSLYFQSGFRVPDSSSNTSLILVMIELGSGTSSDPVLTLAFSACSDSRTLTPLAVKVPAEAGAVYGIVVATCSIRH